MRDRIGQNFPYEIKTNIPKFFHFDIVIILEVRYVCFDFMGQKMVIRGRSHST